MSQAILTLRYLYGSDSIFVVEPDQDGSLFGDGDHEAPVRAELDPRDRPGLGPPDGAEASLFVLPDLEFS